MDPVKRAEAPVAVSGAMVARRWLWLALPIIGVLELAAHFVELGRVPSESDWAALPDIVRAQRHDGTLIAVTPSWAEPVARRVFGESLMPLSGLARADDTAYPDAIEIAVHGGTAAEFEGWIAEEQIAIGPFTVRRFRNPSAMAPRFDFVAALGPARAVVAEISADAAESCPWSDRAQRRTGGLGGPPAFPSKRFMCRSSEFTFAGITVIDDEQYRPRQCIWAHPPPRGALEIEFRDVSLGSEIRGHMGIPWLPARDGLGTPVTLELLIDGSKLEAFDYEERQGWRKFEVSTSRYSTGKHRITWRVHSPRYEYRHFCFEARAL